MKRKTKERNLVNNTIDSSRDHVRRARRAKNRCAPVCNYSCIIIIDGKKSHEILSETTEEMIRRQKVNSARRPKNIVTFTEIKPI